MTPCVGCGKELPPPEIDDFGANLHKCSCGLWYTAALVAEANPEHWLYIQQHNLACRQCADEAGLEHQAFITTAPHPADGIPRVIPCPVHQGDHPIAC